MESVTSSWPLIVLILGIVSVIVLITVLRIHAFISLMLSAILVGILAKTLPGGGSHLVKAIELSMTEFGVMAGKIAFIIALAAILGVALTESGAAEKLVDQFLKIFGENLAPLALLLSGFILSIPVFFDTVFFLLIPIAYSMGKKLQHNYMIYVLAICTGGVITHSLVPPTPGPLLVAESLELNLGFVIGWSLLIGIVPAAAGYITSLRIGRKLQVRHPDFLEAPEQVEETEKQLPSFFVSVLPIVVPLVLIMLDSAKAFLFGEQKSFLTESIGFLGNKNMAMLLGTIIALGILAKQKNLGIAKLGKFMEKPLEIAGVIILITSAGGAFGGMIRYSGITEWIQQLGDSGFKMNYILLAWGLSSLMKIAQGSSTVAMITAAGVVASLTTSIELPYHPIYLFFAVGFGALFISWMNDSGFWVVGKLSGFSEKETLKSWTILLAVIGLVGLIQILILSAVFPMV